MHVNKSYSLENNKFPYLYRHLAVDTFPRHTRSIIINWIERACEGDIYEAAFFFHVNFGAESA